MLIRIFNLIDEFVLRKISEKYRNIVFLAVLSRVVDLLD